jgi:hypothetical protein
MFIVHQAGTLKKEFFYGLNLEFEYTTSPFSQTRFATEMRPIIGWRNPQWEFIVNPIVDCGFGKYRRRGSPASSSTIRSLGWSIIPTSGDRA